ncbi:GGDEF domain-containing protein [Companilactobacillus bobalius]|uniref:Diguanylate cyclase n=2 Tax=Companilactobacillus bobalius TaxID=2801451 RepID=A0A202FFW3_9LACO|nr:GGDEF domain-containing protein [Companilactobacillus bobalius]OVE99349.1 Diguanylate cyclase [Companilactobacillus bobalius]GEO57329.1 GGDEF domain-containing protein [Companilactobacillus paralimentarius]
MTWHVWQVSPFITSIFFILGVFTLYQVLYDWIKSLFHFKNVKMTDDQLKDVFGILYMLIFIFSMQATIVGKSVSWEFMNFQIIALIFCAYFLNIHIPYRYFIPIILVYMIFNSSIGYWESWCHAWTLIMSYESFNYINRIQSESHRSFRYMMVGIVYGGLMWFFVMVKFNLTLTTFYEEWFYLVIFEILLYSYVNMILRDSKLKLHLLEFANHDALTKAENYAAYTTEIQYEFESCQRNKLHLSMMMFDIDHFKHVNDTYGHLAGDKVLQHVADVALTVINANDPKVKFYRTGGEEFNVVFPGYDLESTKDIVDEIFMALNHLPIDINGKKIYISISMGVSTVSAKDIQPNDLYSRVDGNLYHSKNNGRMQITAF